MITNAHYLNRIISAVLGLGLVASGLYLQGVEPSVGTWAPDLNVASAGLSAESSAPALVKVPIKDMRVGTRVPAFNPEVSAAERRGFTEPNWYRWMKLKLEMPKPDGTLLEIEMLRPEDWLIEQMTLVVEPIPVMLSGVDELRPLMESRSGSSSSIEIASAAEFNQATASQDLSDFSLVGVPLRPIYGHIAERLIEAAADRNQVLGMVVELDLPELGIRGPAWIVDLEPAPLVPLGPGQVVTATFKHASANVLDLVLTNTPPTNRSTPPTTLAALNASPSVNPLHATLSPPPTDLGVARTDSIGVTANHPFWSVDRAEFVQAGELQVGERLQTLTGDIHWVQQKLPRPGPEAVYNLEVHDEHVYYVGTNGVLAHNACNGKMWERQIGKQLKKAGYEVLGRLQNRSGHGIDLVLRRGDQIFVAEVKSQTNGWARLSKLQSKSSLANTRRIIGNIKGPTGHWRPKILMSGTSNVAMVVKDALQTGRFGGGVFIQVNEGAGLIRFNIW
ncbi:MAG: hypothetical protein JNK57_21545 [Planctomycetaceae bacterium]|nr:hypothetical protein [Planctomycetaceae bacterium]